MGKRNQVTADLKINTKVQLENSRNFINQLDKIIDGFDFGNKINNQLVNAKNQLKDYNKILEKVQNKSLISDNELKDLVKAGKEIGNIISKTEKLYVNLSSSELQKFSKEYINKVKAQEEAIAKIKNEYATKTGKNFDKELANYDKLSAKVKALEKEKSNLAKNGVEALVTKQIEQTNQKLEEQKNKLIEIRKLQQDSANAYSSTVDIESKKRGYGSYDDIKNVKIQSEDQIRKQLGNAEYKKQSNIISEINKEIKNIEKNKQDSNSLDKAAIELARKYKIENVSTLDSLKQQIKLKKDNLNTYKNNKSDLANEKLVTIELEKQNKILNDRNAIESAGKAAELTVIQQGGYTSKASLTASASATNRSITTLEGQLTESGIENITNTATQTIAGRLDKIAVEIKNGNQDLSTIDETNKKLATQSERAADEQDVINSSKNTINQLANKTDSDGKQTRNTVIKENNEVKKQIIAKESLTMGRDLQSVLKNASKFESLSDLISPLGQTNIFTEREKKKLEKNQESYGLTIADLKRKSEMLKSDITTEEYELIGKQGLENLSSAKNLVNEMAKIVKHSKAEEMALIKQQQDEMIKHDAYGNKRFDGNNPILKSGNTIERYNELQERLSELSKEYAEVDKTQTDLNVEFTQGENQLRNFNEILKTHNQQIDETVNGINSYDEPAQRAALSISKAAEQSSFLSSTFDDFKNKVGYFLSLNYVFDQMTRKVTEAVQVTKEMDKDMTQIGLVLGKTSGQVWKNFSTYSQMAERLNTTTSEVTKSMKLFYQQGLNTAEVNKMVEASAIAAALGESTMAEASETLTSIINSYNLSANEAMMVTDKISQIAIVSAADFGELSTAIEKVASSAASAGLDLDHMMGYLAKMIETTREAPTNIGTALKTIVANFTQFKEDPTGLTEEGTEINKVDKALKSVGISLTNTNGEVRDLSEVLDELGGKWDSLTRNQKSYLATAIAGTRQQSRFYALMNDYGRTLELVAEGSNSAGKAQQQFALYSNSLEASSKRLNNEWEKFFNQITSGNGMLSNLNNTLTFLMKIINKIGPLGTALGLTSLISSLRKGINLFSNLNEKIKQNIDDNKFYEIDRRNIDENSEWNDETKSAKKGELENNLNKNNEKFNNYLKDLGPAAEKYSEKLKEINNNQENLIDKINASDKKFKSFKITAVKGSSAIKKAMAGMPIVIGQIGKALSALALQFAVLIAINAGIKLLSAAFSGFKSALGVNTEAYVENAEKAKENLSTVQGLRDEYETLTSKISLTQEEQKRLKEITEELTEVDSKLGSQIKANGNNYKENIKIMKDYEKQQKKIAAINSNKAIQSEASVLSNWNLLFRESTWANWFGSQSEKNTLKESEYANWRTLASNKAVTEDLDTNQSALLDTYAEKLISNSEAMNQDSIAIRASTNKFTESLDDFIIKLKSLTESQLSEYDKINNIINDDKTSSLEKRTAIGDSNLPQEIKKQLYDQQVEKNYQTYLTATENNAFLTGEGKKAVGRAIDSLSEGNVKKLFSLDNLELLSESEKSKFKKSIADIFNNENTTLAFEEAMYNGTESVQKFIENLPNNSEYEILKEVFKGLESLEDSISKTKQSFEALQKSFDNGFLKGTASQMDIISGILNNTIDIRDIKTIQGATGNILSIDITRQVAQLELYKNQILNTFDKKIEAMQKDIDKYTPVTTTNTYSMSGGRDNLYTETTTKYNFIEEKGVLAQEAALELESQKRLLKQYQTELQTVQEQKKQIREKYNTQEGEPIDFFTGITDEELKQYQELSKKEVELKTNVDTTNNSIETQEKKYGQLKKEQEGYKDLEERLIKNENGIRDELEQTVQSLKNEQQQVINTKNAIEEYLERKNKNLNENTAVFNEYSNFNQIINELNLMKDAFQAADGSIDGMITTINLLTSNSELADYLDKTVDYTRFSQQAIEDASKKMIKSKMDNLDAEIASTETIISLIEARISGQKAEVKGEEQKSDGIKTEIGKVLSYEDSAQKGTAATTASESKSIEMSIANWATWSIQAQTAIQEVSQKFAEYVKKRNEESEESVSAPETKVNSTKVTGKTGQDTGLTDEQYKSNAQKFIDVLNSKDIGNSDDLAWLNNELIIYKNQLERLKDLKGAYSRVYNNIGKVLNGDTKNGSGGGKDKFDEAIEKLEHFYNYLRQLENIEAKLNKIREKRNLIDADKNYYINDLKEENKLLQEQQKIYNAYIADETDYLKTLRDELKSQFGKWVSFTGEGVVQVKQTEFKITSEKEQEKYQNFSELLQEYQNEYNTREENKNKLYEIENTQLENIKTMYDKILSRVTDITDELNRQQDLLDHDMTMQFGSIAQFDIMNEKMANAVKGIKTTMGYLNDFEGQIKDLNTEVKNGPFKELLIWDEALEIWRVNEEKLQSNSIVKKYEKLGYTFSDIEVYVHSIATKSQSIRDAWKETEDSANSFAEALKSLIDDRIGLIQDYYSAATDELNKLFDSFDRKINNIDNENNLFGTVTESLEDKYLTLTTATVVLKQTIQQLNDNKASILQRIQDEYPEYIKLVNGVAVINKQAIQEATDLTAEERAELLLLYGVFESANDQVIEMEDKLVDYFNKMLEMEEAKRDAIINLKQQVHDELMARDQQEIDDLQAKYDKMSQLDNEYYSKLSQKINDARQLRSQRQEGQSIAQTQAKLATLKADSSGAYNAQIIELQKQLNQQLQDQADNDIDRELERIEREQKQREEDRQLTISAMENVLTFKDENNWYWQEAQRIWNEGPESVTGFLRSSREYMNISDEQRALEFENLTNSMNTAFSILQTAAGESDRISDGVVSNKSDEQQEKLDNVNNNLSFIQSQITEEAKELLGKIDWTNAQSFEKLDKLDNTINGVPVTIKDNLDNLYRNEIKPGTEGIKEKIKEYLGANSDIWNKLGLVDTSINKVDFNIVNGFTKTIDEISTAKTTIANGIKEATKQYYDWNKKFFTYIDEQYAKTHATKPSTSTSVSAGRKPTTSSSNKNSSSGSGSKGSGSSTKGPSLALGSAIKVKAGRTWYYTTNGAVPSGDTTGYANRTLYIVNSTNGKYPYAVGTQKGKVSSALGWVKKTDIVGYKTGGYVDYTGVANVHGSKTKPEAFLNAKQTQLFEALRDGLMRKVNTQNYSRDSKENSKEEYNIDNVNIEVKELADTDSVGKITKKIKEEIYKDATGRNNMAIRRR